MDSCETLIHRFDAVQRAEGVWKVCERGIMELTEVVLNPEDMLSTCFTRISFKCGDPVYSWYGSAISGIGHSEADIRSALDDAGFDILCELPL